MNVLVLNAGSSSLKFQVIATDPDRIHQDTDERLCRGAVERIGGEAIVTVETQNAPRQKFTAAIRDVAAGARLRSALAGVRPLGHRPKSARWATFRRWAIAWCMAAKYFKESMLIDDKVMEGIEDCIDLAPLHNPNNLRGIKAVTESHRPRNAASGGIRYRVPHHHPRARHIFTRCRIIYTAGIASAGMVSTARRIATWRIATGSCGTSPANRPTSSPCTWATAAPARRSARENRWIPRWA